MAAAAMRIQAAWRGARAQRRWRTLRRAVVAAQARARGCAARRRFLVMRGAALALQACHPTRLGCGLLHVLSGLGLPLACLMLLRRLLPYGLLASPAPAPASQPAERLILCTGHRQPSAAQAHWRGRAARRRLREHWAAMRLQAAWRGRSARRRLQRARAAATALQGAWRGARSRRRYQHARACIVRVRCPPSAATLQQARRRHCPGRGMWCCRSLRATHDLFTCPRTGDA